MRLKCIKTVLLEHFVLYFCCGIEQTSSCISSLIALTFMYTKINLFSKEKKRKKENWVSKIGIYFMFRSKYIEGRVQLFKDKYTTDKTEL